MVRTSAALFIPGAESLVLSLISYFAGTALMDQTLPSDFSPAMRAVLLGQLVLVLTTMGLHLVIAIMDKSQFVLPSVGIIPAPSSDQVAGSSSREAAERSNLLMLISERTDYRCHMKALCMHTLLSSNTTDKARFFPRRYALGTADVLLMCGYVYVYQLTSNK